MCILLSEVTLLFDLWSHFGQRRCPVTVRKSVREEWSLLIGVVVNTKLDNERSEVVETEADAS